MVAPQPMQPEPWTPPKGPQFCHSLVVYTQGFLVVSLCSRTYKFIKIHLFRKIVCSLGERFVPSFGDMPHAPAPMGTHLVATKPSSQGYAPPKNPKMLLFCSVVLDNF